MNKYVCVFARVYSTLVAKLDIVSVSLLKLQIDHLSSVFERKIACPPDCVLCLKQEIERFKRGERRTRAERGNERDSSTREEGLRFNSPYNPIRLVFTAFEKTLVTLNRLWRHCNRLIPISDRVTFSQSLFRIFNNNRDTCVVSYTRL